MIFFCFLCEMVLQNVPKQFPLLAVTMIRGTIRKTPEVREALRVLGLRSIYQTVYHRNNASVRGQIRRVGSIYVYMSCGEVRY